MLTRTVSKIWVLIEVLINKMDFIKHSRLGLIKDPIMVGYIQHGLKYSGLCELHTENGFVVVTKRLVRL